MPPPLRLAARRRQAHAEVQARRCAAPPARRRRPPALDERHPAPGPPRSLREPFGAAAPRRRGALGARRPRHLSNQGRRPRLGRPPAVSAAQGPPAADRQPRRRLQALARDPPSRLRGRQQGRGAGPGQAPRLRLAPGPGAAMGDLEHPGGPRLPRPPGAARQLDPRARAAARRPRGAAPLPHRRRRRARRAPVRADAPGDRPAR